MTAENDFSVLKNLLASNGKAEIKLEQKAPSIEDQQTREENFRYLLGTLPVIRTPAYTPRSPNESSASINSRPTTSEIDCSVSEDSKFSFEQTSNPEIICEDSTKQRPIQHASPSLQDMTPQTNDVTFHDQMFFLHPKTSVTQTSTANAFTRKDSKSSMSERLTWTRAACPFC